MFSAIIKELSNNAFLHNENGCFYIEDENAIYTNNCKELISLEEDQLPYYYEGLFWFGDYYADKSFTINEKGKKISKPFFFDSGTFLNKAHFYRVKSRRIHGLEQYDSSFKLVKKIEGRFSYLTQSAELLFVLKRDGLVAYDLDLNEKWQVTTEKSCFSGVPHSIDAPQYYQASDLVIINFGENNTPERGEFEINAYQAETGDLVWQQIVSITPSCSHLSGDKVYVCVQDELIILAAATGEVLHRVSHQLNEPEDGRPAVNFLHPYQDKLLVVSPKHGLVQLRTGDAKTILQSIHVPLPYTTSFHPPVLHDDKVYLSLTHADSFDNTMKGGILVLSQVDVAEKFVEANIEERPNTVIEFVQNTEGEDVYQVTFSHDDLDDLIRFSTITLKEIAFKHGNYESSTETNESHHGKLLLKIDAQKVNLNNEELSQKLAIIKERVEANLVSSGVKAGDGKSDFVVDIELV